MAGDESIISGPAGLTLADLIDRAKPMGDLARFVIDDMTEGDDAEFFSVLADT